MTTAASDTRSAQPANHLQYSDAPNGVAAAGAVSEWIACRHAVSAKASPDEASEQDAGRVLDGRIPSLDGFRAISIVFVLIGHIGQQVYFNETSPAGWVMHSLPGFGVKIFYVISGYLITLLLLQENRKSGTIDLLHFYVRRAFRILPAAYTFMAIIFLVAGASIYPVNKLLAVVFAENYSLHEQWLVGHLWSLGVEEQFYLLWPAVFLFLPRRRSAVLLAAICSVPFINVAIIHYHWPYWNLAFYSVADTLACGCLMAILRTRSFVNSIMQSRWFFLIPILTCIASPLALTSGGIVYGLAKSLIIRPWLNIGIALCIEKGVRSAPAILNTKWLGTIGVMSYSIYLWQQPLARSAPITSSLALDLVLRLSAIALCAAASFYLIEQPALRLRKKLFSAKSPAPVCQAS
jgi:peptidoglycan/LPS O-acetylase OafA/YrhL